MNEALPSARRRRDLQARHDALLLRSGLARCALSLELTVLEQRLARPAGQAMRAARWVQRAARWAAVAGPLLKLWRRQRTEPSTRGWVATLVAMSPVLLAGLVRGLDWLHDRPEGPHSR